MKHKSAEISDKPLKDRVSSFFQRWRKKGYNISFGCQNCYGISSGEWSPFSEDLTERFRNGTAIYFQKVVRKEREIIETTRIFTRGDYLKEVLEGCPRKEPILSCLSKYSGVPIASVLACITSFEEQPKILDETIITFSHDSVANAINLYSNNYSNPWLSGGEGQHGGISPKIATAIARETVDNGFKGAVGLAETLAREDVKNIMRLYHPVEKARQIRESIVDIIAEYQGNSCKFKKVLAALDSDEAAKLADECANKDKPEEFTNRFPEVLQDFRPLNPKILQKCIQIDEALKGTDCKISSREKSPYCSFGGYSQEKGWIDRIYQLDEGRLDIKVEVNPHEICLVDRRNVVLISLLGQQDYQNETVLSLAGEKTAKARGIQFGPRTFWGYSKNQPKSAFYVDLESPVTKADLFHYIEEISSAQTQLDTYIERESDRVKRCR